MRMRKLILAFNIGLAVLTAYLSLTVIDCWIPGVIGLMLAVIVSQLRQYRCRRHYEQQLFQSLPRDYSERVLPMMRIQFEDGDFIECNNLEDDWKVDSNMRVWRKDKSKNQWLLWPDVDRIEFFLREFDHPGR